MKNILCRCAFVMCFSVFANSALCLPSEDLLNLLRGNIFIAQAVVSHEAAMKLYKDRLKRLHSDKLTAGDKKFLDENREVLSIVYAALMPTNVYDLPMAILISQKDQYISMLDKLPGKRDYCDICDQLVEKDYGRVSERNSVPAYLYFHNACLRVAGLATAKNCYEENDLRRFTLIANLLTGDDKKTSWLFFIERELKERRYHNVFNNLFSLLSERTDGFHNQGTLKKIAETLVEQAMQPEDFISHLKSHAEETSSMEFLSKLYIISYLMSLKENVASEGTRVIREFREKFSFGKDFTEKRNGLLVEIINADDAVADKLKGLVATLVGLLGGRVEKESFFMYAGYFATFARRFPTEARALYEIYKRSLDPQRQEICLEWMEGEEKKAKGFREKTM